MANPRQRRKARSSAHKSVSHSRHAKRNHFNKSPAIRGPKALQDAWDSRKTVKQNYAALGLAYSLNPIASGGSEKSEQAPTASTSKASEKTSIPRGHGRIIRDECGNVLRVELAPEDEAEQAEQDPMELDMEQLEPQLDKGVAQQWVHGLGHNGGANDKSKNVVKELERIATSINVNAATVAAPISGVGPRSTSERENVYLQRLMDKHGSDVDSMVRDRKLNTDQRTGGELRRAFKRAGIALGGV
ncbi:ribosome biogenesis protein Nop16 [Schizophyllum amplum]|uniref:Nucleolar protein 16 n=1 Tax=Schizophyllum amplum TaxID=97359 RepID=A0A550CD21_9AGAR|nr:ribosome biogenesis protein Nop16 [Auriculariopsis ampla]